MATHDSTAPRAPAVKAALPARSVTGAAAKSMRTGRLEWRPLLDALLEDGIITAADAESTAELD